MIDGERSLPVEDKTRPCAIVTGAAKGIGAACAVYLASKGAQVLINFKTSAEAAEKTAARCRALAGDAVIVQGDVSDDEDCGRIAEAALERWGRLDILINNAGLTRFADPSDLAALSADDFARIFAVNVTGTYQMSRAVAPALEVSGGGSVVIVSSHSGFSGIGSSIAYAASKGALNTMTLSLARSLAPNVRVNAVCPGFVDTDWMAGKLGQDALVAFKQRVAEAAPLKRVVSPDEVAEAVGWFALGAQSITGQLLVVDGGTHLMVGNPL